MKSWLLRLFLAFFVLNQCVAYAIDKNALVGQWKYFDGGPKIIEFFEDDTFTNHRASGKFLILQDGRLKLDYSILGTTSIIVYRPHLNDGVLLLTKGDGVNNYEVWLKETSYTKGFDFNSISFFTQRVGKWDGVQESTDFNGKKTKSSYSVEIEISRDRQGRSIFSATTSSGGKIVTYPTANKGIFVEVIDEDKTILFREVKTRGNKGTNELILPPKQTTRVTGAIKINDENWVVGETTYRDGDKTAEITWECRRSADSPKPPKPIPSVEDGGVIDKFRKFLTR